LFDSIHDLFCTECLLLLTYRSRGTHRPDSSNLPTAGLVSLYQQLSSLCLYLLEDPCPQVMRIGAARRRCRCTQSQSSSPPFLYRSIGHHCFTGEYISPQSSHTQAAPAEIGSASPGLVARHRIRSRGQILRLGRSIFQAPTPTFTLSPSYLPRSRPFSNTPSAMTATKIDGTAIAKKIRERIHDQIAETQKINPRFTPSLKIIQGTGTSTYTDISLANVPCYSWRPLRLEYIPSEHATVTPADISQQPMFA
jgi:hypothetical protein